MDTENNGCAKKSKNAENAEKAEKAGKAGIGAAVFGTVCNLALFFVKLYVSVSCGSLAIYCDGINNLGDTVSCVIAIAGFAAASKSDLRKGRRTEALSSFVIGLILAFTGAYFAYNGVQRLMYPVKISYQTRYAVLIAATVVVKVIMAAVYGHINKKAPSAVFKTLIGDSVLDSFATLASLFALTLSVRINFAVDAVISIAIGAAVAVEAVKNLAAEGKYLIND